VKVQDQGFTADLVHCLQVLDMSALCCKVPPIMAVSGAIGLFQERVPLNAHNTFKLFFHNLLNALIQSCFDILHDITLLRVSWRCPLLLHRIYDPIGVSDGLCKKFSQALIHLICIDAYVKDFS